VRRRQVLELAQRADRDARPPGTGRAARAPPVRPHRARSTASGGASASGSSAAAHLHDIGYSIHFQRHHKHSLYLISTSKLDAFDPREIEIVSHVARYHRGALPKRRHAAFAALAGWQQDVVCRLAALLRVANALDRTHAARVVELHVSLVRRKRVVVEVLSPFDVALELDAARLRAELFERVFDRKLVFRQGLQRPAPAGRRRRV
jgi:exopolyphosphatase/pppGpp-phosphohydrolase